MTGNTQTPEMRHNYKTKKHGTHMNQVIKSLGR